MLIESEGLSIEGPDAARSYLEALQAGSAEPFTSSLFRRAVRPGMVIADIGAFLGQYTLLAARQVGPSGRVYAFEPDPRNLPFLLRNIERNGFSGRVTPVPVAVSDRPGEIPMFLDPEVGSGSSLVFRRKRQVITERVQAITFDAFAADNLTLDLIKLDIEGGECAALDGMAQTLARAGPALTMLVECFPKALRSAGRSTQALVRRLESSGFQVFVVDEGGKRLFRLTARRASIWSFNLYLGLHSLLVVNLLCVRTPDHPLLISAEQ